MVYEPQEDSQLLSLHVKRMAKGRVLDMATGSGILAKAAASSPAVTSVLAVDVDKESISWAKKYSSDPNITYRVSDLFSNVQGPFDTITCNPPYLPSEQGLSDRALVGGKRGYEWICRFLSEAIDHLGPDGIILMVYSSLSKPQKILECARALLLESKELDKNHVFFEDIFVMQFTKSLIRNTLEKDGFKNLTYFSHGKRGLIFTADFRGKKVAVKIKNPSSFAVSAIRHEAGMLKQLNKHGIGPALVKATNHFVAYRFVEGTFIVDFLEKASKARIIRVLQRVFDQCRAMDKMGITKQEMTRPVKHILITKRYPSTTGNSKREKQARSLGDQPILIDFERAHHTHKPHNVTQFFQFLSSAHIRFILASKKIYVDPLLIISAGKKYSKNPCQKTFTESLQLIS